MTKPVIMIVEDDPTLRDLGRRQLTALGFDCVLLDSGEAAVEHDTSGVGLIFMDIGLPGIDGTDATLRIREKEQREQRKRIPIVALTAHSNKDNALLVGMDDFLPKPALLADIKTMLDKWIQ